MYDIAPNVVSKLDEIELKKSCGKLVSLRRFLLQGMAGSLGGVQAGGLQFSNDATKLNRVGSLRIFYLPVVKGWGAALSVIFWRQRDACDRIPLAGVNIEPPCSKS